MDRRHALRAIAVTGTSLTLSACAARSKTARPDFFSPAHPFARPLISPEREIRTTVGLRPFRIPGFRIEAEKVGDKLVIHNYGHGGAGITLSWGSAQVASDLASKDAGKRAGVLGCGVVGLATARTLQQRGYEVTIYTKDVPPQTTSNRSGGFWLPYSLFEPGKESATFQQQFSPVVAASYSAFQLFVGSEYGVRWLSTYLLSDHPISENGDLGSKGSLVPYLPELRDLRPDEHPFTQPYVRHFRAMMIDPHTYLRAQMRDFQVAGGKLTVQEFQDPSQLVFVREPLIFNCTGLGSASLFSDSAMLPIKGQLTVMLPQPEVDYAVLAGGLYMFPRQDGIVLGGTHVKGDWTTTPDLQAKRTIIQGHRQLFAGTNR